MNDTPAIRFNDYTEAWEQRKLGDIGSTYTGLSGKTKEDFGHGNGKFVTYMNVFLNPVSDSARTENVEIDSAQNEVHYGDVFFTTSSETPEEVGMSSVWLENVENTYLNSFCFGYRPNVEIDPYYMAYMLRSEAVRKKIIYLAQGISRYNISKNGVMEISVPLPDLNEQRKVGEYFRNLDNLITLHQRKYDVLVNVKKSMLRKLFPQLSSDLPEVCFNNGGKWVKYKLGDIITPYSDPVETPHDGYTRLGIRSFGKGTFHSYVPAGQELETAKMHRVAAHMFIVNITFGWEHAVAITTEDDAGKLVSHRFPQFAMTDKVNDRFLKYVVLDERFHHHLLLASPGGAGRNRVLSIPQMLEYELYIPQDIEEQKRIAGMLDSLNNLTDLYAEKIQKLKQVKAACLKGMFV